LVLETIRAVVRFLLTHKALGQKLLWLPHLFLGLYPHSSSALPWAQVLKSNFSRWVCDLFSRHLTCVQFCLLSAVFHSHVNFKDRAKGKWQQKVTVLVHQRLPSSERPSRKSISRLVLLSAVQEGI